MDIVGFTQHCMRKELAEIGGWMTRIHAAIDGLLARHAVRKVGGYSAAAAAAAAAAATVGVAGYCAAAAAAAVAAVGVGEYCGVVAAAPLTRVTASAGQNYYFSTIEGQSHRLTAATQVQLVCCAAPVRVIFKICASVVVIVGSIVICPDLHHHRPHRHRHSIVVIFVVVVVIVITVVPIVTSAATRRLGRVTRTRDSDA